MTLCNQVAWLGLQDYPELGIVGGLKDLVPIKENI